MNRVPALFGLAVLLLGVAACCSAAEAPLEQIAYGGPALARDEFNQLAVAAGLPLYWKRDRLSGTLPAPQSLQPVGRADISAYFAGGALSPAFKSAYLALVQTRRLEAVRLDLDQGIPTVVFNDFRHAPGAERSLAVYLAAAARLIDELYLEQRGALRYRDAIPADDTASRALFERNQGPWCETSLQGDDDRFCNAVASFPKRLSAAYPPGWRQDDAMCESLRQRRDAKALLDPFTLVREDHGRPVAAALTAVYGERMAKVAAELRHAAAGLGEDEAALKRYLLAAAGGFISGDWSAADEAWLRMDGRNSNWYLRVGPDETGFEACGEKAGFHLTWGRIDRAATAWQKRLTPLRQEMEDALAALIGPPYRARRVSFDMPDFVSVVLAAGTSRPGRGAVKSETWPNWGRQGRRRSVVMTTRGSDPEWLDLDKAKADRILVPEARKYYLEDGEPGMPGLILHEAMRRLGPDSDTQVNGKLPADIFDDRMNEVLEEVKIEAGALWCVDLLRRKGLITPQRARQIYAHELVAIFNRLPADMYGTGHNKTFTQVAAVQIGSFMKDGAMAIQRVEGSEFFSIDFERLPVAVERLLKKVGKIKAGGDVAGGHALLDEFLTGPDSSLMRMRDFHRRLRWRPQPSFTYTVRY